MKRLISAVVMVLSVMAGNVSADLLANGDFEAAYSPLDTWNPGGAAPSSWNAGVWWTGLTVHSTGGVGDSQYPELTNGGMYQMTAGVAAANTTYQFNGWLSSPGNWHGVNFAYTPNTMDNATVLYEYRQESADDWTNVTYTLDTAVTTAAVGNYLYVDIWGYNVSGDNFSITSVPEPSAFLMLALGLLGLLAYAWRKR